MCNFSIPCSTTRNSYRCQCLSEENLENALSSVATPYTYGVAVLLLILAAVVVVEGKLIHRRFGTVDYFTELSNAKRSRLYIVVLLLNITFLVGTLAALMAYIESLGESVNQAQYQAAYSAIWSSYILQLMMYMDLWSRISPSNALHRFKSHVDATTVDGLLPMVKLAELDCTWSWFMTAEDSLEVVEDGMLFYNLANDFGDVEQMEGSVDILSRLKLLEPVPLTDSVKGATIPLPLHERYVARRFNQKYWKTGIKFSVTPSSIDRLSTLPKKLRLRKPERDVQTRQTTLNPTFQPYKDDSTVAPNTTSIDTGHREAKLREYDSSMAFKLDANESSNNRPSVNLSQALRGTPALSFQDEAEDLEKCDETTTTAGSGYLSVEGASSMECTTGPREKITSFSKKLQELANSDKRCSKCKAKTAFCICNSSATMRREISRKGTYTPKTATATARCKYMRDGDARQQCTNSVAGRDYDWCKTHRCPGEGCTASKGSKAQACDLCINSDL